jgi:hypothetical protein
VEAVNTPLIQQFRTSLCSLAITRYTSARTVQVDLNAIKFINCINIQVSSTIYVRFFNAVRSAVQIINIGERKYVIVGSQSYPLFDPSTVVITLYRIKLSPSRLLSVNSGESLVTPLTVSRYHGIFNGAINAKKVLLQTNFYLYIPRGETISIGHYLYSNIMLPFTKWFNINCGYERYITFNSTIYSMMEPSRGVRIVIGGVQDPIPFPQEQRTFSSVRSGYFSIEQKQWWSEVKSIPIPFHLALQNFNPIRHPLAMRLFNHDFNSVRSHPFNVLRVRSHSSSSYFIDLATGRYHLFAVSAKTYISEDIVQIPSSKYFLARNIGLQTIPRMKSRLCRVVVPFVETRNFFAMRSSHVFNIVVVVEDDVIHDFDAFRSNWMNLIAGEKELINTDGLYRDIFIDTTRELTHYKTPWTPKESSMMRLKREPFFGIVFVDGLDVFQVTKGSRQTFLINWEMTTLSHEHWIIPPFGITPYLKAETADKSNFIILSLSPTGGSIVHMHKEGFKEYFSINGGYAQQEFVTQDGDGNDIQLTTINSSVAEDAALVVGSTRYRRNAKILYEVERGVLWDSSYVDEAVRYMTEFREETFFFYEAPYSPAVLRSIILDKSRGLLNKNIFDKPDIMCYGANIPIIEEVATMNSACQGEVIYIHEVIDDISEEDIIYSFVMNSKDITLSKTAFQVATVFSNSKIGMSQTGPVIDNCSTGSLCSKMIVSEQSLSGNVISAPINPKHTALWVNNRGIYDYAVTPIPPNLNTGDNLTFTEFRSIKFINLQSGRILNRVQSNTILCSISFGTFRGSVRHVDRITVGLKTFDEVRSAAAINIKVKTFSTNLDAIRSDFRIKISWIVPKRKRNGVRSVNLPLTLNKGIKSWEEVSNHRSFVIWLKMFPQHYSGRSEISSLIMNFYITDKEFDKPMSLPFDYADPLASPKGRPTKSRSPDFQEKKEVEIPDILDSESVPPPVLDTLCGGYRSTTFLEYENFDHIFVEGDNQIFGRLTWEDRKFLMSAYLRIRQNTVVKKGVKLSEADILRRTLTEIKLSAIDDLSVVEEWHIEDFTLEVGDFNLQANQSEQLSSIDDAFRAALKSVIDTIGNDDSATERHEGTNQFPSFPDRRVIGDELSQTVKPRQYFIVEEE